MKEYKNTNDLIDFLIAKGVKVNDRSFTFNTIEKYSYYSIVNTYKSILKIQMETMLIMLHLKKYMLYLNLIKI